MCPSSWTLYLGDFPFFGSLLAHLEPKLQLGDDGATNHHHHHPKLQTALVRVLGELEGNQKKENHPYTITKMMGTIVSNCTRLVTGRL